MKFVSLTAFFAATILTARGSSVASTQADSNCPFKPDISNLYGIPNTEVGLASKMVSVNFPGIPAERVSEFSSAKIKIIREEDEEAENKLIHTFGVTDMKKATYYQFALESIAEDGQNKFTVEICAQKTGGSEVCSGLGKPSSQVGLGNEKLDCAEVDPAITNIEIAKVDGYTDADKIRETQKKMSLPQWTSNKMHVKKGDKHIYRLAVDYKMTNYKPLVVSTLEDAYCSRKYIFSMMTAFVEKTTNRILQKFRFTPKTPEKSILLQYINGNLALPIIMELKTTNDFSGQTVNVWHTMCASAKDEVSTAVKCGEPFIEEWLIPSEINES